MWKITLRTSSWLILAFLITASAVIAMDDYGQRRHGNGY